MDEEEITFRSDAGTTRPEPRGVQSKPVIDTLISRLLGFPVVPREGEEKVSLPRETMLEMAKASLIIQRKIQRVLSSPSPPRSKEKVEAEIGWHTRRKILELLISMRKNGKTGGETISTASRIAFSYACLVAAPYALLRQSERQPQEQERLLQTFIKINQGEKIGPIDKETEEKMKLLNCAVGANTDRFMQGVLGEFFAFCLLEHAEKKPKLPRPQEDMAKGIDLWAKGSSGKITAIQIKTDGSLASQSHLIEARDGERGTIPYLIINVNGILKNQRLREAIYSPLPQENEDLKEIIKKIQKAF